LALSKERKAELVAEYVDLLSRSKGIIFAEYRGLSNPQQSKLRGAVRDANGAYHVTKLTLLKVAMQQAGITIPDGLEGVPLGVSFCLEDVPAVARALRGYAKDSEQVSIWGGVLDNQFMTRDQIEAIADLPPLDVLRGQILGLLDAPAASLVGVIQAGVSQVVNVLHAYAEQQGGESAA
jgi:large subunit ribosomal protein L10